MTETITDPEGIVLAGELEDLQAGIAATEQRIEDLARQLAEAQEAEGEAMAAADQAGAFFAPLLAATKSADNQLGQFVGDSYWRAQYPVAADAYGKTEAARDARRAASARAIDISKERSHLVWNVLPALHGARDAKQQELEQHCQQQAAAVEKARSWKDRLRGKP